MEGLALLCCIETKGFSAPTNVDQKYKDMSTVFINALKTYLGWIHGVLSQVCESQELKQNCGIPSHVCSSLLCSAAYQEQQHGFVLITLNSYAKSLKNSIYVVKGSNSWASQGALMYSFLLEFYSL